MPMRIEVVDDELPCAEEMKVVAVVKCKGCSYNLNEGHPDASDIRNDEKGEPEPVYVECNSSHPRGNEEKMSYRGLAGNFYGIKPEPKKPVERKIGPIIVEDIENPPWLPPSRQNTPD